MRRQILEATLETLKTKGFAGATSRTIARAGDFNQALVFYYFGSVDALLLAALDRTSEQRLDAYRRLVDEAETIEELATAVRHIYREDRESGHMTVLAQMIAGSIARPELGPEMVARMQPWIELCEQALAKVLGDSPLAAALPLRELAYAFVTFYLGLNMLTQLDRDDARTDSLFARVEELTPLLRGPLGNAP